MGGDSPHPAPCQTGPCSWRQGLLLAALLGFITTIKLTLWPVTLFVLGLLAFASSPLAMIQNGYLT